MENSPSPNTRGIRINKYLADHGYSTRLGGDRLVAAGSVRINGRVARVGDRVLPDDTVTVAAAARPTRQTYDYFAYNKPRGVVTHSPREGERSIADTLPKELATLGLFPVGRLDKDSHGLIILTNDGRATNRLLSPDAEHEKEYRIRTMRPLSPDLARRAARGIVIEGYATKPAKARVLGPKTAAITLIEGKKHQIRRMIAALGNDVDDLKRIRVASIRLGTLASGAVRRIEEQELTTFLTTLGLPTD